MYEGCVGMCVCVGQSAILHCNTYKKAAVPHTLHLHAPEILEWRLDYGEQGIEHGLCETHVFNSVYTSVTSVLSYVIMQVGIGNNSALEHI